MATYKVTMQLTVVIHNFDTEEQDFDENDELNQDNPKDVHKFLQDQWKYIGIVDEYSGEWELNELKVETKP